MKISSIAAPAPAISMVDSSAPKATDGQSTGDPNDASEAPPPAPAPLPPGQGTRVDQLA